MSKEELSKHNILLSTQTSSLVIHTLENDIIMLIEDCVKETDLHLIYHPEVFVFGKKCNQQRSVGFFSNESKGYKYSGQTAISKPLGNSLETLLQKVNKTFNSSFNGILVNKYENGCENIGAHSDDEKGLDPNAGVLCISYGIPRTLRFRNKKTKKNCI
jgi:alkylated DNA repair dioxygenase AlkB